MPKIVINLEPKADKKFAISLEQHEINLNANQTIDLFVTISNSIAEYIESQIKTDENENQIRLQQPTPQVNQENIQQTISNNTPANNVGPATNGQV